MRNATPVLPFKTRRPTRRHYFLHVNFRPFSFFTRTTHAKINPGSDCDLQFNIGYVKFVDDTKTFSVSNDPHTVIAYSKKLLIILCLGQM